MDKMLKKYWQGKSTQNEEQELKEFFLENNSGQVEDELFRYLEHKRHEGINDPNFDEELIRQINEKQSHKKTIVRRINWRIAAAIALFIASGVFFLNKQTQERNNITETSLVVVGDTFDDPQLAYEETKKALLLISSKLNKGNTYTSEFAKFSKTQENLKK